MFGSEGSVLSIDFRISRDCLGGEVGGDPFGEPWEEVLNCILLTGVPIYLDADTYSCLTTDLASSSVHLRHN